MKKVVFVLILSVVGLGAYAQNSAITKAENYLTKGELDKAKEEIDLAAAHEKTKDKSRTHVVRGKVYQAIYLADSGKYKSIAQNPEQVAIQSYKKAKEMDGNKSIVTVDPDISVFYSSVLNKGANAYQALNYKKAEGFFKVASEINPTDTTGFLYLGVAAQQAQDFAVTKEAYSKLIGLGFHKPDIYSNLIYIARSVDKDENKALELVREAKKRFPNEKNFAQEELNILIATNKIDEAKQRLTEAIAKDPNNPNLYYNLAFMYDQTKEVDKATENYKKAIELKSDYFEAYFNLGVLYYNKAADILKEVNGMDLNTYQKEGKKKEVEGGKKLEEALPYFEKAHKLNSKDVQVAETLSTIYSRLNRQADVDRMKKVMDSAKDQ